MFAVLGLQGYIVLNRPWAFVQWLLKANIEEEYICCLEFWFYVVSGFCQVIKRCNLIATFVLFLSLCLLLGFHSCHSWNSPLCHGARKNKNFVGVAIGVFITAIDIGSMGAVVGSGIQLYLDGRARSFVHKANAKSSFWNNAHCLSILLHCSPRKWRHSA